MLEFLQPYNVRVSAAELVLSAALIDVAVSDRLGNVPRRLQFADGGVFETADNDQVDAMLRARGGSANLVHWLEQRWPVAIASLVAVALLSFVFIRYGVPALAALAARELPASVDRALGAQTLGLLDRSALEPSSLPVARRQQLKQLFATMTNDLRDGHDYRLELRRSKRLGANAFALPSGIIVMTDELVALSRHDEELVAVLAHEIGHVRGRHALRQLLQAAGVSAIAFAVLGDVSSVSALVSAAPALLEAKHSRDLEREADAFARDWLRQRGIAPQRFDDLLCRMEAEAGTDPGAVKFLSTHPATDERARCVSDPPRK